MGSSVKRFVAAVCAGLMAVVAQPAFAAEFSVEVVDVFGQTSVKTKGGEAGPAKLGMKLHPGDSVTTSKESEVELLYDDGNVTRVGEETTLKIKELTLQEDKSRTSILELASGQVKNSVSKLVSKKSKFEVHTQSAIAGVSGTPPWVVKAGGGGTPGQAVRTEVDLVDGPRGEVYVKGAAPGAKTVFLTPGTRTIIPMGGPPLAPFRISPARLIQLNKRMPITTPPAVQEERRKQLDVQTGVPPQDQPATEEPPAEQPPAEQPPAEAPPAEQPPVEAPPAGDAGKEPAAAPEPLKAPVIADPMLDHIIRNISVSTAVPPGGSATGESSEEQTSQTGNTLPGQGTGATVSTTTVKIKIGIQTK